MPGVRPLNHPAFLQGREAFRSLRTRLYFNAPIRAMLCHPCLEGVMVILLIRTDRAETRKVVWRDMAEQSQCRNALIHSGTRHHDGNQHAQRIDQQMPRAPCDFLPAVIPALGTSHLGGLDRLALDAGGTGGWLASRFHTGPFSQCLDQPGPGSVVAPLGTGVLSGALGQYIVREHIPLTATAIQGENRVEYCSHVHLARAPSSLALLGGWDHRCHDGPLLVRQI
jgi:hypothetical protein